MGPTAVAAPVLGFQQSNEASNPVLVRTSEIVVWEQRTRRAAVAAVAASLLMSASPESPAAGDGWKPVVEHQPGVPSDRPVTTYEVLSATGADRAARIDWERQNWDPALQEFSGPSTNPPRVSLWDGSGWSAFLPVGDKVGDSGSWAKMDPLGRELFIRSDWSSIYRVAPNGSMQKLVLPGSYARFTVVPGSASGSATWINLGVCSNGEEDLKTATVENGVRGPENLVAAAPCSRTATDLRSVRLDDGRLVIAVRRSSTEGLSVGVVQPNGAWSGWKTTQLVATDDSGRDWKLTTDGTQAFIVRSEGRQFYSFDDRVQTILPVGASGAEGPAVALEKIATPLQCAARTGFVWPSNGALYRMAFRNGQWSGPIALAEPEPGRDISYLRMVCSGTEGSEIVAWSRFDVLEPFEGSGLTPSDDDGSFSGQVMALLRTGDQWTSPLAIAPVASLIEFNGSTNPSWPLRAFLAPDGSIGRVDLVLREIADGYSDRIANHYYSAVWDGSAWTSPYKVEVVPYDPDDSGPPTGGDRTRKKKTVLKIKGTRPLAHRVVIKVKLAPAQGRTLRCRVLASPRTRCTPRKKITKQRPRDVVKFSVPRRNGKSKKVIIKTRATKSATAAKRKVKIAATR